jgi:predicted outer membrane repeat protein
MKPSLRSLITLLCAVFFSLPSVDAATTYTVQNTGDGAANAANCPGSGCRLRDALAAVSDGDTIDFSVTTPATITLNTGELLVNKSITISGSGTDQLSVNGNAASRVFHISSGKTVIISGVTITNGAADGAGTYNDHSTLTLSNCTLSGNSTYGVGGGIYNDGTEGGSATLTINNCTLSGNSAGLSGGGIYSDGRNSGSATLTINNSTISGNSASLGGGIVSVGRNSGSATLTINNSTVSGNVANGIGGIYNNGNNSGSATLTINNSTISGNSATTGAVGGIWNNGEGGSATLTINNCTLSGNSAPSLAGGIFNDASGFRQRDAYDRGHYPEDRCFRREYC